MQYLHAVFTFSPNFEWDLIGLPINAVNAFLVVITYFMTMHHFRESPDRTNPFGPCPIMEHRAGDAMLSSRHRGCAGRSVSVSATPAVLSQAAGLWSAVSQSGSLSLSVGRSAVPVSVPCCSRAAPVPLLYRNRTTSVPQPYCNRTATVPQPHRSRTAAPVPPGCMEI